MEELSFLKGMDDAGQAELQVPLDKGSGTILD